MVNVGVIGLGPSWERRYFPAIGRLGQRLRVRAVYDAVFSRSTSVAGELKAAAEGGLLALANRPDVDALLLLDSAWYGREALRLVCGANKPVYIAADVGDDPATLQALHWTAMSYGLTLMPEMGRRYTPASARLQELMATCLGRPHRVTVGVAADAGPREFVAWFDWIRYVIRGVPRDVEAIGDERSGVIRVGYATTNSPASPSAELHLVNDAPDESAACPGRFRQIECERGRAIIESSTVIRWETGDDSATESLTADREATDVMLDHFCRRVVGGLIPVADLADISQGLQLVKAAAESRRAGRPVSLEGSG